MYTPASLSYKCIPIYLCGKHKIFGAFQIELKTVQPLRKY